MQEDVDLEYKSQREVYLTANARPKLERSYLIALRNLIDDHNCMVINLHH